jgi:hypothetical protein
MFLYKQNIYLCHPYPETGNNENIERKILSSQIARKATKNLLTNETSVI